MAEGSALAFFDWSAAQALLLGPISKNCAIHKQPLACRLRAMLLMGISWGLQSWKPNPQLRPVLCAVHASSSLDEGDKAGFDVSMLVHAICLLLSQLGVGLLRRSSTTKAEGLCNHVNYMVSGIQQRWNPTGQQFSPAYVIAHACVLLYMWVGDGCGTMFSHVVAA